jgi:predicted small integral membrane protein
MDLAWMAWTQPVAVFFIAIAVLLIGMTLWELHTPSVPRKGLLPLTTTRGDRLFIGLLLAGYVNLAWIGLTDLDQWWAAGMGTAALIAVMRWG